MRTNRILSPVPFLLAAALSLTGCDQLENTLSDFSIAEDDVLSTNLFDDVFMEVEEAAAFADNLMFASGTYKSDAVVCKIITIERPDTSFWPKTVTVDYGQGCEAPNGRVRKGKIIITVSGRYMEEGSVKTVSFEDFYINDFRVEGIKTITNEGKNKDDQIYFTVTLAGGRVSNDTLTVTKEFSRVRTWISGSDTPGFHPDDEYLIEGSASGVNRRGIAYTRTITSPLYTAVACRWIKSGTVLIEAEGRQDIIIDYGDGTCDNKATVTIGDESREIELPRHRRNRS